MDCEGDFGDYGGRGLNVVVKCRVIGAELCGLESQQLKWLIIPIKHPIRMPTTTRRILPNKMIRRSMMIPHINILITSLSRLSNRRITYDKLRLRLM